MAWFRRRASWPPTPFGFVPPPEAEVRSWACLNRECRNGEHEPDPRFWPRRCPECGGAVGSGVVREPWDHHAKRAELEVRLADPRDDVDYKLARYDDYEWRYKDALLRHDLPGARKVREELDGAIVDDEVNPYSEGHHRWAVISQAVKAAALDDAAAELLAWHPRLSTDNVEDDNMTRTTCRQWVGMALTYLEHPMASDHPAARGIFERLAEMVYEIREVMMVDAGKRYKQVLARYR